MVSIREQRRNSFSFPRVARTQTWDGISERIQRWFGERLGNRLTYHLSPITCLLNMAFVTYQA